VCFFRSVLAALGVGVLPIVVFVLILPLMGVYFGVPRRASRWQGGDAGRVEAGRRPWWGRDAPTIFRAEARIDLSRPKST
jgi:hypothetical protein